MAVSSITTPTQTKNAITSKVHSAYNYSVFEILFSLGTTLLEKVTMFLEFSSDLGVITQSNTYNYSVLNITKMRRDVSKILQSKIKTVCPLNFSIPTNTSFPDTNSFQMYRVCVVYNTDTTIRTDWFYAGAGVFQKFHERKGNYIDYMVHLGAYTPPAPIFDMYYGFPTSFRSAIAFRFNAKDVGNFALRVDSSNQFVTGYTDPISGIQVNQTVASSQPTLVAGGALFDGTNDNLRNFDSGLQGIREAWAVATYDLALAKNYDAIFSISESVPELKAMTALGFDGVTLYAFSGHRVNNISTTVFLPATGKKTVSANFPDFLSSPSQLHIGIDRGVEDRCWQGQISDVILFNRNLTTGERADLQAYLQTFHSFTP